MIDSSPQYFERRVSSSVMLTLFGMLDPSKKVRFIILDPSKTVCFEVAYYHNRQELIWVSANHRCSSKASYETHAICFLNRTGAFAAIKGSNVETKLRLLTPCSTFFSMPNRTVQLQADQADHKTRSGPNCLACVFLQRQKAENENKEGDRKKHEEPFIICSNLFLEENKAKITKSQGPFEVRCHRIWMSSSKGRTVSIQLTESS